MTLFHLTTTGAWTAARTAGEYRPDSLDREGSVHLSTKEQWPRTLYRFYREQVDTILLVIDSERLRAEVRFERADGEDFPHLYGSLNLDAVITSRALQVPDPALDEIAFVALAD